MQIHERLKAERERLCLSQTQMGELLAVGKTTVINWEKGASAPDAVQLGAFATAGADVLYILTGQRSQPVPPTAGLSRRAAALLDNFEHTDEEGKKIIEGMATLTAKSRTKNKAA